MPRNPLPIHHTVQGREHAFCYSKIVIYNNTEFQDSHSRLATCTSLARILRRQRHSQFKSKKLRKINADICNKYKQYLVLLLHTYFWCSCKTKALHLLARFIWCHLSKNKMFALSLPKYLRSNLICNLTLVNIVSPCS